MPSHDELIEASVEGQAAGYSLGWSHGYAVGYRHAQTDRQDAARAALVARAGVEAVDVVNAREKAAQRARAIAAGWSE